MRVLHVVEPWSGLTPSWRVMGNGSDTLFTACALARGVDGRRQPVCVIGPTAVRDRAAVFNMRGVDRIAPPLGRPELGWRALRRLLHSRGPFDQVICWGSRAGRMARLAVNDGTPVTTASLAVPGPGVMELGPAGYDPRQGRAAEVRFCWARSGPPTWTDRRAWRRAHRIGDDEIVLALLDDAGHAAARRFLFLLGTLEVAERRVIGLMPNAARESARARRFHRGLGLRTRIFVADRPMQALLSACDMAVLLGPFSDERTSEGSTAGMAAFNLSLALGTGLPVVMAPNPVIQDAVTGGRCIVAASDHLTDLGRRLLELATNGSGQDKARGVRPSETPVPRPVELGI